MVASSTWACLTHPCAVQLNEMEIEARGMDRAVKRSFTDRIRKYRGELSELARDLGRAQERASRAALVGGGDVELAQTSMSNRSRLLEAGDRMDRTTATLAESRRTLEETTEVGTFAGSLLPVARISNTLTVAWCVSRRNHRRACSQS